MLNTMPVQPKDTCTMLNASLSLYLAAARPEASLGMWTDTLPQSAQWTRLCDNPWQRRRRLDAFGLLQNVHGPICAATIVFTGSDATSGPAATFHPEMDKIPLRPRWSLEGCRYVGQPSTPSPAGRDGIKRQRPPLDRVAGQGVLEFVPLLMREQREEVAHKDREPGGIVDVLHALHRIAKDEIDHDVVPVADRLDIMQRVAEHRHLEDEPVDALVRGLGGATRAPHKQKRS